MKTLRVLMLLLIMSGFISNNVNCQPIRQEYDNLMGINLPCESVGLPGVGGVGEFIKGVVHWERTQWDNKIQLKVIGGTLIGQESGLEYSVTEIINHEMWYDQSAINKTFTRLLLIRLENKLVARMPIVQHYTINANGEETVDFTSMDVDCK